MGRLLAKCRWQRRQHAAFIAAEDILRPSGILMAEMIAALELELEIGGLHATNARKNEIVMSA